MGLFSFFKRIPNSSDRQEDNATQSGVNQAIIQPEVPVPTPKSHNEPQTGIFSTEKAVATIPVYDGRDNLEKVAGPTPVDTTPTVPSRSDNASYTAPVAPREIRWPRNGSDAHWLANSSFFFVYTDAHFLRSKGAQAFVKAWRSEKQAKRLNRNWFIPQFELDLLSEEESSIVLQWSDTYGIRNRQNNYADLFSAAGGKPIVFLTCVGDHTRALSDAAARVNVRIQLYSVGDNGRIYALDSMRTENAQSTPHSRDGFRPQRNDRITVNAFDIPMRFSAIGLAERVPSRLPTTNMTVRTDDGGDIVLGEPIMSNTSSITYATNNPSYYAKIYTVDLLKTTLPEQKCRLMLTRKVEIEGVCWPVSALTVENGIFVGILVPGAEGMQLRNILLRESAVRQNLPDWNRRDLIGLALTLLNVIQELQRWHIYIGCLNLASILIKDRQTVYFADMDDWQIEGYPVLSENKIFTPPELQTVDTRLHFYNQDEINYQIAYLTFMLMMPGRLPYAQRSGSTLAESTAHQEFAFGMGEKMRSTVKQSQRDVASGFWRFVWDHISYDLGVDFYQTFAYGGTASTPGKRLPITKWIADLMEYRRNLEKPEDEESLKLFPASFRRTPNRRFIQCGFCKKEHPDFYMQNDFRVQLRGKLERIPISEVIGTRRICKTCYHESAELYYSGDSDAFFTCKGCGKVIYYTNSAKITHEYMERNRWWEKQNWCSNCKETYEERVCMECGKTFKVTVGQFRLYGADSLPKRCVDCQKKKRARY